MADAPHQQLKRSQRLRQCSNWQSQSPCMDMVYTWALRGCLYPCLGLYVCAVQFHVCLHTFGMHMLANGTGLQLPRGQEMPLLCSCGKVLHVFSGPACNMNFKYRHLLPSSARSWKDRKQDPTRDLNSIPVYGVAG